MSPCVYSGLCLIKDLGGGRLPVLAFVPTYTRDSAWEAPLAAACKNKYKAGAAFLRALDRGAALNCVPSLSQTCVSSPAFHLT